MDFMGMKTYDKKSLNKGCKLVLCRTIPPVWVHSVCPVE